MLLALLALAHADDIDIDVHIEAPAELEPVEPVEPVHPPETCRHDHHRADRHEREPSLQAQYGMLFLPDAPAHHVGARHTGSHDAYLSADLRYLPASDLMWTGRVGAGLDLLGGDRWDLTLGLFLGTAGEWDRTEDYAVLYAKPMAGTEVGLGVEGERLFARYRWVAGLGTGAVDQLLTENELTVGYRLVGDLAVYGQYLRLNPGEAHKESGIGLGVRAIF